MKFLSSHAARFAQFVVCVHSRFEATQARYAWLSGNSDGGIDGGSEGRPGTSLSTEEHISVDPPLYYISPFQSWAGRLASRVYNNDGVLEDAWLPRFSRDSSSLRRTFLPLLAAAGHRNFWSCWRILWAFSNQFEVGGMIALGFFLEAVTGLASLLAPWLLHKLLAEPRSASLATWLVMATLASTLAGRTRDQVTRTHAVWTETGLRTTILAKALRLSPTASAHLSPARIISISTVDVDMIALYVQRLHDIWSAPAQILAIAALTTRVMGVWPAVCALATMALLFIVQGRASLMFRDGIKEYVLRNDTRLSALRLVITRFAAVKALAVEPVFRRLVEDARAAQLDALRKYLVAGFSIFTSVSQTVPGLVACAAFFVYWAQGHEVTPQVVFPALAYFNLLYQPVFSASLALSRQFSVRPSLARIAELLGSDEFDDLQATNEIPSPSPPELADLSDTKQDKPIAAVKFTNATFAFLGNNPEDATSAPVSIDAENDRDTGEQSAFLLRDISRGSLFEVGHMSIPAQQLTLVIGPTGSGKSSLLLSILGELPLWRGKLRRPAVRSMAYAAQESFVLSGSLRENVCLGSKAPFNAAHYYSTIRKTGLDIDFAGCPGGAEGTVISEEGGNLSGGQKARIGLARALYADADLLLLDDPLAAVDAKVRRMLFDAVRAEARQGKRTVILATLHTQYVASADYVVVTDQARVVWSGSREAFMQDVELRSAYMSLNSQEYEHGQMADDQNRMISSPTTHALGRDVTHEDTICLVAKEERAVGAIKWSVLTFYARSAGGFRQALGVFAMVSLLTVVRIMNQYWFVWWLDQTMGLSQATYMAVYAMLILVQSALIAALGLILVQGSIYASQRIHQRIVHNLLQVPMAYIQSQPTGRVLNRMAADVESLDIKIMNAIDGLVAAATSLVSSLVLVAASGNFMFIALLPFITGMAFYLQRFRVGAREVQRTASLLASPVVSVLSESLSHPSSVRAYAPTAIPFLRDRHAAALDALAAARLTRRSLDTWVTLRAETAATAVLAIVALLACLGALADDDENASSSSHSQSRAGLALGVASALARNVYLLAWSATDLEIQMNSAERLMVYHSEISPETPIGDLKLARRTLLAAIGPGPKGQFRHNLNLRDVFLRYPSRDAPALDGVTLSIPAGQRLGILGRSGSGKSTLLSILARLVTLTAGTITLGGVDISTVPPPVLRTVVHTLPQEPFIFPGTVRLNLDPEGKHTDEELLDVLEACRLRTILADRFGPGDEKAEVGILDRELGQSASELSAGQRQLLCAARVLLAKPPVLLVDEAAANIDFAGDAQLQHALRWLLPESTTLVVVAHRAASLAWMDRVVTMRAGTVVENGTPLELLQDSKSYFASMILEDGKVALRNALQVAKESRRTGRKTTRVKC
ncbi:hypothetical protein MCOR29_001742 [Pyricularia oryzae]|nr:hypothetical protein MCOR29_001742 [Pyricularia oryzae]KAI6445806.1 hypothetical protein MCOR15_010684 [Pyricularia oryzae]KAI6515253.1 hypothetical protein MCOR16_010241 [Pyricularia oryzae]KAI6541496.1 hypothetical protein MCOR10_000694 [Pyricularia oryzae]KAI6562518.1 hypothetical protein MCOR03_003343 [Pyricularia oryzae]